MPMLPSLFISHGAPNILLRDIPASRFLRGLGQSLPRPRAIVVATAHWTTAEVAIGCAAQPDTIHDFSGFGPELSSQHYGAPGDSGLAEDIRVALTRAGLSATTVERGLDHGVWVPLALMYPDAHIPVVPISVQPARDGRHHLAVGAALAALRQNGILIIGSGSMTHNLGALRPAVTTAPPWVTAFDDWVIERAAAMDDSALADWQQGPGALRNHPTSEHFLPLLVAMGASAGDPGRVLHRSTDYGVLQMTMLAFANE